MIVRNKFEHRDKIKHLINNKFSSWMQMGYYYSCSYDSLFERNSLFTSRIIFKDRELQFNKNYSWRQKYCTQCFKVRLSPVFGPNMEKLQLQLVALFQISEKLQLVLLSTGFMRFFICKNRFATGCELVLSSPDIHLQNVPKNIENA